MRTVRTLLLCALALSAACVTTASEGEQMRQDIAALQKTVQDEKDANQKSRDELAQQQAKKAKELSDALDALNRAARKSGADMAVDLEKAQNDVAALRGQNEVLSHRLDTLEKSIADQQAQLNALTQAAEQRKKELDKAEHPTDRMGIIALAHRKLEDGQTGRARELFSDFLQRFPKDELADDAQFGVGQTYFVEKKWNDAILEFQRVIKNYKSSPRVPDALLQIGQSFQAQGDCQNAQLFYEEVIASHGKSGAAKTAREKSAQCKKAAKPRGKTRAKK